MNVPAHVSRAASGPSDVDRLVSGYCAAWNDPDPQSRLRRLQTVWRDDSTFENAASRVTGLAAMNAHIGECGAGRWGWRFVVPEVAAHGRHVHLSWLLVDATGGVSLAGHDVGELGDDRRLQRVVSFWRRRTER